MAILVDEGTKLVVQGLTGREGSFHGLRNREYGATLNDRFHPLVERNPPSHGDRMARLPPPASG